MVILGIDPGSRITGFGVVRVLTKNLEYLDSGTIRVKSENLQDRLLEIHRGILEIGQKYSIDHAAIEQVFVHFNIQSALKLGQARGAALTALGLLNLSVSEYSARQIKQAVVGYGAAEKAQVQEMVQTLLNLNKPPSQDASDALACAICHSNTLGVAGYLNKNINSNSNLNLKLRTVRGRWRQ